MHLSDFEITNLNESDLLPRLRPALSRFGYSEELLASLAGNCLPSLERYRQLEISTETAVNCVGTHVVGDIVSADQMLSPQIPFDRTEKVLRHLTVEFDKEPLVEKQALLASTLFVDTYGLIQIQGTNTRTNGINCLLPEIGGLGMIIKDGGGNITAAHPHLSEQPSVDTFYNILNLHWDTFGYIRNCFMGLAGLSIFKGALAELNALRYPVSSEIDTETLKLKLRSEFPDTDFSFLFSPQRVINSGDQSVHITNEHARYKCGWSSISNQTSPIGIFALKVNIYEKYSFIGLK